jgi:hypothetical protein
MCNSTSSNMEEPNVNEQKCFMGLHINTSTMLEVMQRHILGQVMDVNYLT